MNEYLVYFSGWIFFIICYYIYHMYFSKNEKYDCLNNYKNKKLIIYDGFKWGVFSWFGLIICIMFIFTLYCIYGIIYIDSTIENFLKK